MSSTVRFAVARLKRESLTGTPVVSGKVLAPDLQNPEVRIVEWAPESPDEE